MHYLAAAIALIAALPDLSAADMPLIDGGVQAFADVWIGGGSKELVAADGKQSKVLKFVVETIPEQPWMAQTWVAPLKSEIAMGDELRITLSARCNQGGMVEVVLGMAEDPYFQVLSQKIEPGPEWREYAISGQAGAALAADQGRFGFVLGFQRQTVEVADIVVINRGKSK